jgi:hypothetical protein
MVGRQDLDRPAEHLAAEIVDRHLRGLDLAEVQIGIDAGESFGDADLEWRGRLGLRQGDEAHRGQADRGRDHAGVPDSSRKSHNSTPPRCGSRRKARNLATVRARRQCCWTAAPSFDLFATGSAWLKKK